MNEHCVEEGKARRDLHFVTGFAWGALAGAGLAFVLVVLYTYCTHAL